MSSPAPKVKPIPPLPSSTPALVLDTLHLIDGFLQGETPYFFRKTRKASTHTVYRKLDGLYLGQIWMHQDGWTALPLGDSGKQKCDCSTADEAAQYLLNLRDRREAAASADYIKAMFSDLGFLPTEEEG